MILKDKTAVIYGGGGSIGGAVARVFAREGARVYLAGRTQASLDAVAEDIRAGGGEAETAEVDALDERAVDAHADDVAAHAGSLDISFNLIGHDVVQGTPMAEMDVDDYVRPVTVAVRSHFLTARAAARHMTRQRSGVILAFGGEGDPQRGWHLGSLQVVFHAIESMRRQLSSELGEHGVGRRAHDDRRHGQRERGRADRLGRMAREWLRPPAAGQRAGGRCVGPGGRVPTPDADYGRREKRFGISAPVSRR
jgi:NAD(P)-dependent dehydrogenase (short-subunit alcohol dehydrogenase family)